MSIMNVSSRLEPCGEFHRKIGGTRKVFRAFGSLLGRSRTLVRAMTTASTINHRYMSRLTGASNYLNQYTRERKASQDGCTSLVRC